LQVRQTQVLPDISSRAWYLCLWMLQGSRSFGRCMCLDPRIPQVGLGYRRWRGRGYHVALSCNLSILLATLWVCHVGTGVWLYYIILYFIVLQCMVL